MSDNFYRMVVQHTPDKKSCTDTPLPLSRGEMMDHYLFFTDRRLLKKDPDVFLKRRDVLSQTPRRF